MLQKDKTTSAAAKPKEPKPATRTTRAKSTAGAAARQPATKLSGEVQQRIQQRAYELWENEGRPHGREQAHWQQAEREIAGQSASGSV
jgi:hypothetical protein